VSQLAEEFCGGINRSKADQTSREADGMMLGVGVQPTLEVEQNPSRRAATDGCDTVSSA